MTTPKNTTNTKNPNHWLRAIEFRKHRLGRDYRATLSDAAREGISDDDYATTMATLEKMARNLGWDDSREPNPQGHDHGHGHGHRFGRGHSHPAMMRGFGPRGSRGACDPTDTNMQPEA